MGTVVTLQRGLRRWSVGKTQRVRAGSVPSTPGKFVDLLFRQNRTREITNETADCAREAPELLQELPCNVQPCRQDCVLTEWSPWSQARSARRYARGCR
jgi:hypothetical protein